MALKEFLDNGIELATSAKNIEFANTHDNVVDMVRKNVGTIGTVRTDQLEQLQYEGKSHMKEFKILNKKEMFSFVAKVIKFLHAEYRIQGVERNAGYPSVDKVRRKTCLNESRRHPGFKADLEDFWLL